MTSNNIENIKTWILYIIFMIYLVIGPVGNMLNVIGIGPAIPAIYFILAFLCIYILLAIFQMTNNRFKLRIEKTYFASLILLIYVIVVQLISGLLLVYNIPFSNGTVQSLLANSTILFSIFFIFGGRLAEFCEFLSNKKVKIITILSYLFYCGVIYWTSFSLGSLASSNLFVPLDYRFNYLLIADTFAILTLVVMWMAIKSPVIRWIVGFNAVCLLYMVRSRTTFYIFIFCLLITFFLQARNKKNWVMVGLGIFIFFSIGGMEFIFSNQTDIIFTLIFNPSSDESFIGRQQLLAAGLKDLKDYWLAGLPMAEVWNGRPGDYIHNYLSFWVCYGLIPFFTFIVISIKNTWKLMVHIKKCWHNGLFMFIVSYFVFCYGEIITSRSYIFPYVWACLSAVPIFILNMKSQENNFSKEVIINKD